MSKKKKRKQIERICKNCKLFDATNHLCHVVILHEGQRVKLPVDEEDACFFEEQYFDPTEKAMTDFAEDIQQVRFWVEDDKGERTNGNGTVKVEYPEGFFGKQSLSELLGTD